MTEQMLRQYTVLVEYLGATLGPDYEVVLHEILPETSRVAAIANGTISGRDVGAPISNAALRPGRPASEHPGAVQRRG